MKSLFIRYCLSFVVLASAALPAFSETVRVSEIDIEVTGGNTREAAVLRWMETEVGSEFPDQEALDEAVARDVQELENLKVFISVRYEISTDPVGPESTDRRVLIQIQDGPTFVPVPLPLYDSNTGGIQLLYVQIWDNMFGTLTDWFSLATLTLRRGDDGQIETGPFLFSPKVSNIKAGNLVFGVGFEQERVETQRYSGSTIVADYRYDRTALYLSTEFRFGANRRFYYTIEPAAEFRYGYVDDLGAGGYSEYPWGMELYQGFYYDSVNAVGNSRRGWRTGLSNTTKLVSEDGLTKPITDLQAEISPYVIFDSRGILSYYARLSGLKVWGTTYDNLGESMRGIPDATMDGDTALFLNQTLGVRLWRWAGAFDLQVHPFFDIGLAAGGTEDFNGWGDIRMSTGADVLLFIEPVPNLAFRFTWGVDLDSDLAWGEETKTEFIVRYAFSY